MSCVVEKIDSKSKLARMEIFNLGCIGPEGLTVELDNMLCLVGANNCGKSTVLRAYELAVGNRDINIDDKCKRSGENDKPTVVLYIHIPKGMANIDEKWKFAENDMLLVKSKWEWDSNLKSSRHTWDPSIDDYAPDGNASGLDTVFSSRLPIPFRINALEEPKEEHKKLLTLILQPINNKLKAILEDKESNLTKSITAITKLANAPVVEEKENLDILKEKINKSHNQIFPSLNIDFNVNVGEIKIDLAKQLIENSNIKFFEWANEIDWDKQGTGSQRALFWSMMQVRSELKALEDVRNSTNKQKSDVKKQIIKLGKELEKAKGEDTKTKKIEEIRKLNEQLQAIEEMSCELLIEEQRKTLCLPGYMLLIDEPEIALHPNAIRAASKYLYGLSKDDSWQVMLTTHSPQFINPLEDHTTIVRLERNNNNPTPKTYIADEIRFEDNEKSNLKMLCQFDTNLSEMFFGQYPIIIEGDTEYAAFEYIMQAYEGLYPLNLKPVLVRARGKYTVISLIKMLTHFKIDFSVLNDSDYPFRKDGAANSAWKANEDIFKYINEARSKGIRIIHRISLPCFEIQHTDVDKDADGNIIDPDSKEKAWNMLERVKTTKSVELSIKRVLDVLIDREADQNPFGDNIADFLIKELLDWAKAQHIKDKRILKEKK